MAANRSNRWWKRLSTSVAGKRSEWTRARSLRPRLEALENRVLPSVYTVNTTADNTNSGSLRWAIMQANANHDPSGSTINFSIGSGVQTIALTSPLPAITAAVTIDGTTQPGYGGTPVIVLDGSQAGSASGLLITSAGSTVRALAIDHFSQPGITITSAAATNNLIVGNFIGTDATGTLSEGNFNDGIFLGNGANNNTIENNLISGNAGSGVDLSDFLTAQNTIAANYIGTNAAGTAALANDGSGVLIQNNASGNTIGGQVAVTLGRIGGSGNLISGNLGSGVQVAQGNNNSIEGNFIGTDATGEVAIGNDPTGIFDGIDVFIGFGNFIGGVSSLDGNGNLSGFGNLISGNIGQDPTQQSASGGVFIGAGGGGITAPGTTVEGNFIGTDVTGTRAVGNANAGVVVFYSSGNFIGGSAAGAGNVISANGGDGITLFGQGSTRNTVSGNFIGTNASGTASLGNTFWGIELADAPTNTIGGTSPGAGNLLSGNDEGGVAIYGQDASGNAVQGNLIGTDYTGTQPLGNAFSGIYVGDAADFNSGFTGSASNNTIGGLTPGARNIISANGGAGVWEHGGTGNLIEGNYIGTDVTGTTALGTQSNGVQIDDGANNNTVGGSVSGARNLISGNGAEGVDLSDNGTVQNTIAGNYIGTNAAGTAALPNFGSGVFIWNGASGNTIGGQVVVTPLGLIGGSGNLISGNLSSGVQILQGSNNSIEGNFIGTDATGEVAIGNAPDGSLDGVDVFAGFGNVVGGVSSLDANGNLSGFGNLISGNIGQSQVLNTHLASAGVLISATGGNTSGPGTTVEGNFIGTDVTGTRALGNAKSGVIVSSSSGNVIGGSTAGTGNVISANGADGITLLGQGSSQNTVSGNFIGTNASGTASLGNTLWGMEVADAGLNFIGGNLPGAGNVVSGNDQGGIAVYGRNARADQIWGNLIGTDVTGTQALGNNSAGIYVGDAAEFNTGFTGSAVVTQIGGTNPGQRNTISGNLIGIWIHGSGASGTQIQGNYIGTDVSGTVALGNIEDGVVIDAGASGNSVGVGVPGYENVISGNQGVGVYIATNGNLVTGNFIGTDVSGQNPLPNTSFGVDIENFASGNIIGTVNAGSGNTIAFNGSAGVEVGNHAFENTVRGNSIYGNAGLGIELQAGTNESVVAPTIQSVQFSQSTPGTALVEGTFPARFAGTTYTVDFYANSTIGSSGISQGRTYLGSIQIFSASSPYSFDLDLSNIPAGEPIITATATDFLGDTSEFSPTVIPTATTVTYSANPVTYGDSLTLTATVSPALSGTGTPSGTVTFFDGGTVLATGSVINGVATASTSTLAAGNHAISAVYSGDSAFSTGSNSGPTLTVSPRPLLITANSTSKSEGSTLTFAGTEFTTSGLVNGDAVTSVALTSTGAAATAEDGTYSIAASAATGTGLSNYTIAYVAGTLTVAEPPIAASPATLATVVSGQASASVEVATFTHANGVEPTGDFTATVNWGIAGHSADPATITEDGNGTYHVSATRPVLAAGSYSVTVSLAEDHASASVTDSLLVNPDDTTTTLVSSANPSTYGDSVMFTATVGANAPGSGTPTGMVSFLDGTAVIGTGTLSGGTATFSTTALVAAGHSITAAYSGDGNFNTSTSTPLTQTVNARALVITANDASKSEGDALTFAGTEFTAAGLVNGDAVTGVTLTSPGAAAAAEDGSYSITASAAAGTGLANYAITYVAGTLTVAEPPIAASPVTLATVVSGQASAAVEVATFTHANGVEPTGDFTATVDWGVPGHSADPAAVTQDAAGIYHVSATRPVLAAGSYSVTVSVTEDDASAAATDSLLVNPDDTTTTLTAAPNPSVYGQAVTFTATVTPAAPGSGTPTGMVSFLDGGTVIGTGTLSGSIATFTTAALSAGSHSVTASYGGDGNFNASSAAAWTQTVNADATSTALVTSVNPSALGQGVTFTATVSASAPGSGTPTGTVSFLDGTTVIGTGTLSGGTATFTTSALALGSHPIKASYGGSSSFTGSTSAALTQTVLIGSTSTVTSSANPSVFGQSVTFTATVHAASGSQTPTGTVQFLDGTTVIATGTLSGGKATFKTSALATGTHTITVSYGGNSSFTGSISPPVTQTVNQAGTTTKVTSSSRPSVFGQSVTFTATVTASSPGSGTATGTVLFMDGTTTLGQGSLNASGQATFTTSSLAVGSHSVTAVYGGDGNFTGSTTAALTQTVNADATTTAVVSSANPSVSGQSVTFTATVSANAPGSGIPAGTVTFKDGSRTLGTAALNASGQATFATSALAVGSHSITASYAASTNFKASTSAVLTQTVNAPGAAILILSGLSAPSPSAVASSTVQTAGASTPSPASFLAASVVAGQAEASAEDTVPQPQPGVLSVSTLGSAGVSEVGQPGVDAAILPAVTSAAPPTNPEVSDRSPAGTAILDQLFAEFDKYWAKG
jgi:hypothetical protein